MKPSIKTPFEKLVNALRETKSELSEGNDKELLNWLADDIIDHASELAAEVRKEAEQ